MEFSLYVLNVICSSGQSALGKRNAAKGGNSTAFNINKALLGILLFLIFGFIRGLSFHIPSILFGLLHGVFLCISMNAGFQALKMGPMALTSIIASFSLVIPLIFGITVWGEKLSAFGVIGIILLLSSIVLLNFRAESGLSLKWSFYALLTMLANGICSLIQKHHQLYFPSQFQTEFMLSSLVMVLLIFTIAHMVKKEHGKIDFGMDGVAAGVLNGISNYVVLCLAATENASVLFPMISVVNVIAVWFIGKVVFKERLKPMQLLGLVFGVTAIVLLKL